MLPGWKLAVVTVAGLVPTVATIPAAVVTGQGARIPGAQSTPQSRRLAAGEAEARKLVLLMDTDKNGKVSKQEFMAFMEAEFNRLDKDQSGELDVQELLQFQLRTKPAFSAVGK
jgi:hypothetical protein